jgi:hypothetical protein
MSPPNLKKAATREPNNEIGVPFSGTREDKINGPTRESLLKIS